MKPIITLSLVVILLAALASPAAAAAPPTGGETLGQLAYIAPSFSIVNVDTRQSVTITTTSLAPNDSIQVLMGNYGTGGVGGTLVGTFSSGAGGQYTATYAIPASLRDAYQIDVRLQSTVTGLHSTNWFYNNTGSPYVPPPYSPPPYPAYPSYPYPGYPGYPEYPYSPYYPSGVTPTISILSVVRDASVTFQTNNFPANRTFNVRMGPMGTMGINGTLVGTFYSGSGGSQTYTFNIPANLFGSYQISIRTESTTGGYYSYDWFYNNTSGSPNPPYGNFSFSVLSVVRDQSVTIQTSNFPANQTYNVRMGPAGSQGINGTFVDTVNSSTGGTMVLTFYIPANLRGLYQIDLRLESQYGGSFAYNTFYNSAGPTPPGPFEPSFTITSVVRDQSVTLQTYNFPASSTYNVLMGYPGTYYQSGFPAGTLNTGPGGSFTATFSIPTNLRGASQILIWLVNNATGQVVSSTFYNSSSGSSNEYYPSFTIVGVVRDQTVTIQTSNFPPNDTFNVRMGAMGTNGVNGTLVGSINSGSGGSFSATFNIPPNLFGSYQIAIRLESPYSGYYAYNWFYNNSTGPIPPDPGTASVTVTNVVPNQTVTVQTYNFPAATTYNVLMGHQGTNYTSGFPAGTFNSGSGGSFSASFNIPTNLYGASQIWLWFVNSATNQLFVSTSFYNNSSPTPYPPYPPYNGIPTFTITSVVRDQTVTIVTSNFPANDTFNVRMGPMGTQAIGGTLVGSVNSGSGGSFSATFNIPPNLFGSYQIAVRLESPTSGYYAYNWFYNNTTGTPGPIPTPGPYTPVPPYTGTPSFTISSVVRDTSVTVLTSGFPPNDTYDVLMGPMGTQAIGGTKVGTFNSGSGGSFTATFSIPANLAGSSQIAVRMQSPTSGYYAYNWFYNNTSP